LQRLGLSAVQVHASENTIPEHQEGAAVERPVRAIRTLGAGQRAGGAGGEIEQVDLDLLQLAADGREENILAIR
jgi:hypothetical protein